MLILTRRFRQSIVIDGRVKVTVVSIAPGQVQLGIQAPQDVVIDREEVHRRKRNQARLSPCRGLLLQAEEESI